MEVVEALEGDIGVLELRGVAHDVVHVLCDIGGSLEARRHVRVHGLTRVAGGLDLVVALQVHGIDDWLHHVHGLARRFTEGLAGEEGHGRGGNGILELINSSFRAEVGGQVILEDVLGQRLLGLLGVGGNEGVVEAGEHVKLDQSLLGGIHVLDAVVVGLSDPRNPHQSIKVSTNDADGLGEMELGRAIILDLVVLPIDGRGEQNLTLDLPVLVGVLVGGDKLLGDTTSERVARHDQASVFDAIHGLIELFQDRVDLFGAVVVVAKAFAPVLRHLGNADPGLHAP
mmetsp:Transcript_5600/g.9630  ORF Transcript_5600/g.9630 Transcript_5600/m.9630 type:complete len:285 (-) Transcript_5600:231-1085(-)